MCCVHHRLGHLLRSEGRRGLSSPAYCPQQHKCCCLQKLGTSCARPPTGRPKRHLEALFRSIRADPSAVICASIMMPVFPFFAHESLHLDEATRETRHAIHKRKTSTDSSRNAIYMVWKGEFMSPIFVPIYGCEAFARWLGLARRV